MDNDDLIAALDSYDEELLRYVDAEQHLSVEAVTYIAERARWLLAGRSDWDSLQGSDWHGLTYAFVIVYETPALEDLRAEASMGVDQPTLTSCDRAFLQELAVSADRYWAVRAAGKFRRP